MFCGCFCEITRFPPPKVTSSLHKHESPPGQKQTQGKQRIQALLCVFIKFWATNRVRRYHLGAVALWVLEIRVQVQSPQLARGFGISLLPVKYWHQPTDTHKLLSIPTIAEHWGPIMSWLDHQQPFFSFFSPFPSSSHLPAPKYRLQYNQSGFILFRRVSHSRAALKTHNSAHSLTFSRQGDIERREFDPVTEGLAFKPLTYMGYSLTDSKHLLKHDTGTAL